MLECGFPQSKYRRHIYIYVDIGIFTTRQENLTFQDSLTLRYWGGLLSDMMYMRMICI